MAPSLRVDERTETGYAPLVLERGWQDDLEVGV
jgi:hypothetical protein